MAVEMSDGDWRAVLDDLREQVTGMGFGDWDHHAALYVEDMPPADAAITYLREFVGKQKRVTSRSLAELKERLSRSLRGPDEQPVSGATLVDNRFERERESDLFDQIVPTDEFVEALVGILAFLESGDEGALS